MEYQQQPKSYIRMLIIIMTVLASLSTTYGQAYLYTWENILQRQLNRSLAEQVSAVVQNKRTTSITKIEDDNNTQIIYKNTFLEEDGGNDISETAMDVITIIWYVASFLALAAFFLLMACSDRRCRRNNQEHSGSNTSHHIPATKPLTPTPSYTEFAPPSYDTVMNIQPPYSKDQLSIYVIPFPGIHVCKEQQLTTTAITTTTTTITPEIAATTRPIVNFYIVDETVKQQAY